VKINDHSNSVIEVHEQNGVLYGEFYKSNSCIDINNDMLIERLISETGEKEVQWDGNGLPPIGYECEVFYNGHWHRFIPRSYHKKPDDEDVVLGDVLPYGECDWECGYADLSFAFRKIEDSQQYKDRLEAAYDLFVEWQKDDDFDPSRLRDFDNFKKDKATVNDWLRAVDKANYRKQKDGE
jgi:hypothetical protein